MSFQKKYLKYKKKYLELKNQIGGVRCDINLINFTLKMNEIKALILNKSNKKIYPAYEYNIIREIMDWLNSFSDINESCDDISSKQLIAILNEVKVLQENDKIDFFKKYPECLSKLNETISKIQSLEIIIKQKEEAIKKQKEEAIKKQQELEEQKKNEAIIKKANKQQLMLKKEHQLMLEKEKQLILEKERKEQLILKKKEKEKQEMEQKRQLILEEKEQKRLLQIETKRIKKENKQMSEEDIESNNYKIESNKINNENKQMSKEDIKLNIEPSTNSDTEFSDELNTIFNLKKEVSSSLSQEHAEFLKLPQVNLWEILSETDKEYLSIIMSNDLINKSIKLLFSNIYNDYTEVLKHDINFNYYRFICNFIIILIGILNYKLKQSGNNIKFVLKGGKAIQMLISKYNMKLNILSDDIDILVLCNDTYNKLYVKNMAEQFAGIINIYINNFLILPAISILSPEENMYNKNIIKISFIKYVNGKHNGFIPISDIDFKEQETDFFKNLEETSKYYVVRKPKISEYKFELLYYHQTIDSFIDEKKFYLNKYLETIQHTSKGEVCDCNSITHSMDCKFVCNDRDRMITKFNKYIIPFEKR